MSVSRAQKAVFFVVLGVAAFMLKRAFAGPHWSLVTSYLGNVSISFALYFLARIASLHLGRGRLLAVVLSLLAVEAFEVTHGFGVMLNTFDPWDLLANACGVAVALAVDILVPASPHQVSRP